MVRRALASKIGVKTSLNILYGFLILFFLSKSIKELANVVEKEFVIGELITNFKALAGDDMVERNYIFEHKIHY
jgi:hypothetical protein